MGQETEPLAGTALTGLGGVGGGLGGGLGGDDEQLAAFIASIVCVIPGCVGILRRGGVRAKAESVICGIYGRLNYSRKEIMPG